jgi:eukaryotic-like serine/threonine-protein kinase
MMPANRSQSAAATDSLIGQTIGGQYTLQRFLGQGSKARVFLATHRTLHRPVVVHLLGVSWVDDAAAVAKFEEQARALRGFEHPNIASLIDFGREPGRVLVISEFVEGKRLDAYVQQLGRLTLDGFVPIAAQILKGLGATHARGLVHRDLKPGNVVLVEEQGRANYVKLLDLGLAQLLEGPSRGEDAPVVGTPDYLAPEQIMNKPVDPRTDVYSLGVLFYQMLSGRLPFVGDGHGGGKSVLYQHVNDKPIPLTQALSHGSTVPAGLIDLVHDCLAKNPDNRPGDANEIVERLIDSVPAALFRLPVAGASARTPTAELRVPTERVRGTTGEHRVRTLTSDLPRAPTGEFRVVSPRAEPLPQHDRALAAAVEASGLRPLPAAVEMQAAAAAPPAESSGGSSSWVLGLFALLLTSGLVYVYIQNQGATSPTPPPAKVGVAAVAVDVSVELDTAAALEASGKLPEAIAAYEQVLARDAANPRATERIAALKAMLAAPPPTKVEPVPDTKAVEPVPDTKAATAGDVPVVDTAGDATAGDTKAADPVDPSAGTPVVEPKPPEVKPDPVPVQFLVECYPKAEILVDGVSHGKTPQTLNLPAGPHKFELKAPGFLLHEETIEVAVDGQKSMKAKLVRRTGGSGGINRDEENAASNQLDPENDAPTTKVEIPLKPKK